MTSPAEKQIPFRQTDLRALSGIRGRLLYSVALLLLLLARPAGAVPASPHVLTVKQPNGIPIKLQVRGDEYSHWLEDTKGYTVVPDAAGKLVYARSGTDGVLEPTELVVGKAAPQSSGLKPGLQPPPALREQRLQSMAAAAGAPGPSGGPQRIGPSGTVKNLVILCRFSDHTAAHGRTQADYNTLFNAVGGDAVLAPSGSVRDYFTEVSYGMLTLQSTVVAWVTLPQTEAYYGAGEDGLGSYPQNGQRMTEDALNLANSLVNFAQFDQDNDGYVDAIDIIHSGYGGETGGGGGNWIWSHKWSLPVDWSSGELNGAGAAVKVRDYHSEPALWGTSGTGILRIGVICHETGHFFGLPDLYDTDGGGSGIGSWCLMANSWGFDGTQLHPPHPSAWCRVQLGWVTPTVISTGFFTAPGAATNATVFKITGGYPAGEYLLVENRQPFGFENVMPQGGLCVWHIDGAKSSNQNEGYPGQPGWPANNNHYRVALLQADGLYDLEHGNDRGDSGDVFRAGGVAALSDTTAPSTQRYQGGVAAPSGNRIESISAAAASMTFSLNPAPVAPPVITSALAFSGATGVGFTYQITATNAPASFSATGLPAGLGIAAGTGIISGTPGSVGTFNVGLGATNGLGTGTATLVLTITDLSEGVAAALETPGRAFSLTGNATWFPQLLTSFDSVDAIQSGDIADGGSSNIETTITGPVNVSFFVRVSSEENFDYLRFSVDGQDVFAISGEESWSPRTLPVGAGLHVLRWSYSKDNSVSSGSDTAWVDMLSITPISSPPALTSAGTVAAAAAVPFTYQITATNAPTSFGATGLPGWLTVNAGTGLLSGTPPAVGAATFTVSATNSFGTGTRLVTVTISNPSAGLADALDVSGITFTSAGVTPWSSQTAVTYDGQDAAASGAIGDGQMSTMQTTVTGPGTVSFFWKVSSELGFDYLTFLLDGQDEGSISGESSWTRVVKNISAGTHTLQWIYRKDETVETGLDRGWVDRLSTGVPAITSPLSVSGNKGGTFVYQITATGSPTSFEATGLPPGLSVVPGTGIIDGIPSQEGVFNTNLSATNSFGTGSATLQIVINPPGSGRQVLVPFNAAWRCLHPMGAFPAAAGNFATHWFGNETAFAAGYTGPPFGSAPPVFGTDFIADTFDSFVSTGPFGYGSMEYFTTPGAEFTEFSGVLTTPQAGNRRTAYFRTTFTVTGDTLIRPQLRYFIDDGAFIYLDGQLLGTVNFPEGTPDSYALLSSTPGNEALIYTLDPTVAGQVAGGNATIVHALTSLSAGTHTLAVSVHSTDIQSTDLAFGLELSAETGIPAPEIALFGGPARNVSILSGDLAPSTVDRTDFGNRSLAGGPVDTPFLIVNGGSTALTLGTITSSGSTFAILPGYASAIPAGGSTVVSIRYTPVAGASTSTISIPSDDADENPFTFLVYGFGSATGGRQTLVPWNYSWKYFHPMGILPAAAGNFLNTWYTAESTFAATYTGPVFGAVPAVFGNPASTASFDSGIGNGPIGYEFISYMGDSGAEFTAFGRALTTPATNNRRTAYFRTTFTVPAGGLTRPQLRYLIDDGAFIYLDGVLLCTVNMAAGVTDTYTTLAAGVSETETILRTVDLRTAGAVSGGNAVVNNPASFLSAGTHTLAVSARSNITSSSDLCLALELTAEPGCAINATASSVFRHDGGNSNPADDTLSFTLTATGLNAGSGWVCAAPAGSGFYGLPVNFTGVPIASPGSPLSLVVVDNADPSCTMSLSIPIPQEAGLNLLTGGGLYFEGHPEVPGISHNTRGIFANNGSYQGQTQLFDLTTADGPFRLHFELGVNDTSFGTNFESDDLFRAELVLDPGPGETVVDLLARHDRDTSGALAGYTGTTAEPYDTWLLRDEFNLFGELSSSALNHVLSFNVTIPDAVASARVRFTLANNSSTETLTLSNFTLRSLDTPDTDMDGLDDLWEEMWFGFISSETGGGDADNDGATNAAEALAGTSPLRADSILRLLSVSTAGATQTITIQTVPGRRYRIETSSTLQPSGWSPAGQVFTATSTTTTRALTLSPTATRVYVRASIVPP